MKRLLIFSGILVIFGISSCKKCYECICTNPDELFGCAVEGERIELCDKGLIGKSVLTTRILDKESEGYTCNVK